MRVQNGVYLVCVSTKWCVSSICEYKMVNGCSCSCCRYLACENHNIAGFLMLNFSNKFLLFSWHLHEVLCALGYIHLSEDKHYLLQHSYAAELELVGLWHWAVFVLMHLRDDSR